MLENKNLSIIIVNYRSERHIRGCIASVYEKLGSNHQIVVVNNDKTDIKNILSDFQGVKVVENNHNPGFGAGANLGSRHSNSELVLFLNPDARINSNNLEHVFFEFSNEEKLAILGASPIGSDGKIQPWSAGQETGFIDIIRNNIKLPRSRPIWKNSEKILTDWVSGTAMFVRRKAFQELGGFDEKFFMYFEDMDLCKRARAAGKKVLYFPDFRVTHLGGKSYFEAGAQKKDYYDSLEYYFMKHRSYLEWRIVRLIRKIFF